MAARRARPEKKILSKQEVSSRKKALAVRRVEGTGVGHRALVGVAILALSSLALVALLTEPGPFAPRTAHNGAGPVGHALAALLGGLLGIAAPAIPLAGVYVSGVLLVGRREKRRWPQVLAALVLLVAGCVLLQLGLGTPGAHARNPPGGALGVAVAAWLVDLFEVLGTVIVVSAVAFAAMLVATQFALLRAVAALGHLAGELGAKAKAALLALWAAQKKALAARVESRAAAKLEEAAFLAQLEADEEELTQAEAEALEAEAVAEEAMRLARESETRALERGKDGATPMALPPGADPVWTRELAAASAPAPAPETSRRRRKGDQPEIVTPPAPTVSAAAAVAAMSTATTVPGAEPELEPVTAIVPSPARAPLIVEPKAPPKPTARQKEQNQFEFVGGRTQFTPPPLDVLDFDRPERSALDKEVFLSTAEKLRAKLADFGIVGDVVEIRPGPVVTMYEFLPGPGIKVSKIAALADDLAMAMEAMRVRIVAPIPGKGVVGIEVPNRDRETVYLKEIVEQDVFQRSSSKLTMALGKDIEGMPYVLDLAKAPHVLAAGTTGSGKSVAVNSMVMSILLKATPEEVRFIMVDPKMLELSVYEGIPHLLLPVVTDPKKAALALRWAVEEMERRYQMLSEAGVRNIAGYNKLVESAKGDARVLLEKKREAPKPKKAASLLVVDVGEGESEDDALARAKEEALGVPSPLAAAEDPRESLEVEPEVTGDDDADATEPEADEKPRELKKLPYLVVIIDELADLMMVASREVETYIARLAQMARAAGIHLLVATQRPSTDVVTGVIKANFPTRISFMLRTKPDSMTILGTVGAESLLGMGDMLIMPPTSANMVRVHGAYVSEQEIKRAVDHLKSQGKPVYDDSILRAREEDLGDAGMEDELSDELYDQALAVVSEMRQVSISMLQRKMRIGYNRAARMIERMERDGVVGPADGAKPREVLLRPLGEMPGAGAA
jgi:S-DNA-T family DNA segregation ATPase FtsK/SpoIIIE